MQNETKEYLAVVYLDYSAYDNVKPELATYFDNEYTAGEFAKENNGILVRLTRQNIDTAEIVNWK